MPILLKAQYAIRPIPNVNIDKVRSKMTADENQWTWNSKYLSAFQGRLQYFEISTSNKKNPKINLVGGLP